ncbi:hypothetical protein ABZP36_023242 [Zizania latifolia]
MPISLHLRYGPRTLVVVLSRWLAMPNRRPTTPSGRPASRRIEDPSSSSSSPPGGGWNAGSRPM